ncbi:biopolymer transport protein ExbB [Rhodoblastus acidophilus]|uniref:MotA/TolQ/ExbB proton channel family protein n=1 Tax=Rhodoblastus acidophilus TaxID=1074 RepID=UPI002223F621|nr:MotA/TolQ/ExbB proton channel family protein [Rhodoblastus acidophilus]MCW2318006.1 biopolymer transport protein ExbB [Rhodoblastus acidophilus]
MAIDTAYFHHICIVLLWGMLGLLTLVLLERLIYYILVGFKAGKLARAAREGAVRPGAPVLGGADPITRGLAEYVKAHARAGIKRERLEDLSAALFIDVDGRIGARLWLLDTIVTAAPLLGLLGTILGIMDAFNALSSGGVSDPAAVSRGIAAALVATAIGIFTALCGLVGHNFLHRMADNLTEQFKRLILLTEAIPAHEAQASSTPASAAPEDSPVGATA